MAVVTVQPSSVKGEIFAPASKSSMQRACAAALVRKGISIIHNPGISNDDKAALDIINNLGANTTFKDDILVIESNGVHPVIPLGERGASINCGESGLSIRMFTPIVSLSNQRVAIKGSGSLTTRPMDFFDEILPQLGVDVQSNNGRLPLSVQGPFIPKDIEIDGSLSSQFLTGLLMAYATASPNPSKGEANTNTATIKVNNLKSKPYIDLTLKVMKDFGLLVPENINYKEFIFKYDSSSIPPLGGRGAAYTVEGDWSGGAFLLVAGAIAGNLQVKGLDINSTQADKKILEALKDSGAIVSIQYESIEISTPLLGLNAFQFDATDCPDLFPPLVALAAYCKGTTVIEGVSRLAHKESNRALTLQEEFGKMGIEITLQDDLMLVKGTAKLLGNKVHSHHDHRIAMACAVAGLKAEGNTIIEEADAINKSYPNFYEHLQKLGVVLHIN